MEQVISQGVEIQLKVLQTLVSLLTTTVGGTGESSRDRLIQGEELGQVSSISLPLIREPSTNYSLPLRRRWNCLIDFQLLKFQS